MGNYMTKYPLYIYSCISDMICNNLFHHEDALEQIIQFGECQK